MYEYLQEKDKDAVHRRYEERLSGKEPQEVHHVEICSKNGNKIPCEAYSSLIQYDGRPALLAIIRDISKRKQAEEELKKHRDHLEELVTERTKELQKTNEKLRTEISEHKQTEEALRKSEGKFRLLAENATDVIWTLDMNLGLTYISPSVFQLRGYTVEEAMAQSLNEMLFPQSSAKAMAIFNQNLQLIEAGDDKGWAPVTFEAEQYCKDGTTIITRTSAKMLKGSDGRPNLILGVTHDITNRKQAAKLIRDLSHQLLTSQESERQRISFELHDSVAQDLSTSKIICEMLLKDNSFTPEARKQVSEVSDNLHKTLSNVRDLSYELRPPGLEDLGLTHTMHELCDEFSKKTGVRNDFQSAGMDNLNLNYNTKINLYRVLQEALNNVRKHSDASNVKIRLIASFPNIILRIEDDGKGFDLKDRLTRTSNEKRMGLSSMEERVGLLLGRIDIKSIPGKGTKVFIEVPQRDENIGASD